MPSGPFTISYDCIIGDENGLVRVVAVPHITVYRIPREFTRILRGEQELKQAGIYLLINTENKTLYVGQADICCIWNPKIPKGTSM